MPIEEQPYEVPGNWVWVKLGSIIELAYGKSLPNSQRSNKGYPVFGSNGIVGYHDEFLIEGPVIIVGRKGSHGEVNWFDESGWAIDTTYYVKTKIKSDFGFIYYLLRSLNLKRLNRSTAIPGLNREDAYNESVPLPPLNEQKRIADKVERLLDKINQAKQLIEEAKATFELRRAAILDKAFRGELTRKWREENSQIDSARKFVDEFKEGNTRNKNKIIHEEEINSILYELPDKWIWTRLMEFEGDEQLVLTGPFGTSLSNKDFVSEGVPVLTIGCLQDDGIKMEKANFVIQEKADELERYKLKEGDILFSRMATVGRASIVNKEQEGCLINYHIMRLRLPKYINVDYFLLVVKGSPATKAFLNMVNHGMTRDGINTNELLNLPIPFPPIEEQKQIVDGYNQLLAKEKEVGKNLGIVEQQLLQISSSVLTKAFRGTLGTNDGSEQNHFGDSSPRQS